MLIVRKVKTFVTLPWSTKVLFAEAFFTSAWVKASLKFFPFKRVMGWLGGVQVESDVDPDPETLELRRQVKAAIALCNKYAPWPTECYTQSLTGKLLLRRRKIRSTLYIGFMKDEEGKYKGHAWLRANDLYISGIKEARGFQIHSRFS